MKGEAGTGSGKNMMMMIKIMMVKMMMMGDCFCVTLQRCLHWPTSRIPLGVVQLARFTH